MRWLALASVALCACGGGSAEIVYVDPPAHRPLQCTFELDEAFSELALPDGRRITQHWEMAATSRGVLYAPVQRRSPEPGDWVGYVTGVARFEGAWTVESVAGEWWQVWDLAASDDGAWMTGEVGPFPSKPMIVQRKGGAWTAMEHPPGLGMVYRLFATPQGLFALGVESGESAWRPRLARHDAGGWKDLRLPAEWTDVHPVTVRALDGAVIVGLTEGRPGTKDAKRGLLARVDGDRLVAVASPLELPPIHALSGSSARDLLVLGGPPGSDPKAVYWLDTVASRGKLVHEDRETFADVWSPRPGVALLAPSYYHAGRLTVLDGHVGPSEVELEKPGVIHFIARFAAEGDGRTVHFLVHENSQRVQHRRGVCP